MNNVEDGPVTDASGLNTVLNCDPSVLVDDLMHNLDITDCSCQPFGHRLMPLIQSISATSEILVGPLEGPPDARLVPIDALEAVEGVPDGKGNVVDIHNGCLIRCCHFQKTKNNWKKKFWLLMRTDIQKPDSSDKTRNRFFCIKITQPILLSAFKICKASFCSFIIARFRDIASDMIDLLRIVFYHTQSIVRFDFKIIKSDFKSFFHDLI